MVRVANLGRVNILFCSPNRSGTHPACCSIGSGIPSRDESGRGIKVTTFLHLAPSLMSVPIPLVPYMLLRYTLSWPGHVQQNVLPTCVELLKAIMISVTYVYIHLLVTVT